MNDTPTAEASPDAVETPELSSIFIAFFFKGKDNGVPKEGFDSRVVKVPSDVKFTSAEDLKAIADAIASSEFHGGKRYADLEISILSFQRLPL